MADSPKFVSFFEALRLVAESLGSEALAWEDLPKALKDGKIRALADIQHLHEIRGNVIREVKDHVLTQEWWSADGRFGRLLSNGNRSLNFDVMTFRPKRNNDGWSHAAQIGTSTFTKSYDNIRLYLPELIATFSGVQLPAAQEVLTGTAQAGAGTRTEGIQKRAGPRPVKMELVMARMRQHSVTELAAMKKSEMESHFDAAGSTCLKARDAVLSEIAAARSKTVDN